MTHSNKDTIAAIATAPGRGGVGIVRVSGPKSFEIAKKILGKTPKIRKAEYLPFNDSDDQAIDTGIALLFQNPNSFTGEDILELQAHGGPVVLDMILKRVLELGARPARAGEFTEQAFINDKMDLAQAEAVADLIEAESAEAAKAAVKSLQGEFSKTIYDLVESLIELRLYVEASLDFPEEEIDFLSDGKVEAKLALIEAALLAVFKSARQGCLLREGMTLVIAGRPNAGKSSLLNQLAGRESAIVTDIPGTTRDVLREHIQIDGLPLHVIDTAGLRESEDPIEQEGVRRAWKEIEQADRIILLVDDTHRDDDHLEIEDKLPRHIGVTRVFNKIDTSGRKAELIEIESETDIALSAKTGAGMDILKNHLKQCMGYEQSNEGRFMARRRHIEALENADQHLQRARYNLIELQAGELLAEELRMAQDFLSQITGEFTSDDLLGKIFSSFCIGK
ncbi:MAG: tRNA uridine-5-carboxymethylaminomethyl(34) synthesis GTPase MnmE [endosymbiont of Galathealinum brachiosum]|uniref:tRNA modification GTPase MnmE n=1 Tax=endosymbiont of Galathealinum brachiosum TaxID=2200906 RepID=A0A370DEU3_9GAMM|nr:MAG: tRNA uridine-5-carboxymethylaminomethyl(34) synthesis GTPase MnmE [endosymbiont of Galathealinum brachiosum]